MHCNDVENPLRTLCGLAQEAVMWSSNEEKVTCPDCLKILPGATK